MLIDELARREGIAVDKMQKNAATGRGRLCGQRVVLAKPMTFMNLSGDSVGALVHFYKVPPAQPWLVYAAPAECSCWACFCSRARSSYCSGWALSLHLQVCQPSSGLAASTVYVVMATYAQPQPEPIASSQDTTLCCWSTSAQVFALYANLTSRCGAGQRHRHRFARHRAFCLQAGSIAWQAGLCNCRCLWSACV